MSLTRTLTHRYGLGMRINLPTPSKILFCCSANGSGWTVQFLGTTRGGGVARGMATTSWGGQDAALLVDREGAPCIWGCRRWLRRQEGGWQWWWGKGGQADRFERTRGRVNNTTTSQQARGKWEERHKWTRGGGTWNAGGASRGQEAAAARLEVTQ